MGVRISEILKDKYFKKYKVLAGENGLNREVQAVALFDAPDGYKWFKGKEFVITTGYLLQEEAYFKEVLKFLHSHNSAGMGIKVDRYLKKIPDSVIDLCNEIDMPLIDIPFNEAWIDVINAVNSIAVNRFITKLIDKSETYSQVSPRYLQNKILDLIGKLNIEINNPITIVQDMDKKGITCPASYIASQRIQSADQPEDYDFSYMREVVCDKLNIIRYKTDEEGLVPWLIIPVKIRDLQVARLIIWEEHEKIDYYDLLAIRMTVTLLSEIYEQIYLFNNFESRYYDDFIKALISGELDNYAKIQEFSQGARKIRIAFNSHYRVSVIKAKNPAFDLYACRDRIYNSVLSNLDIQKNIFGIVSKDEIVIVTDTQSAETLDASKTTAPLKSNAKGIQQRLSKALEDLKACLGDGDFSMGIGSEVSEIISVRRSYVEAVKAMEVGQFLFGQTQVIAFEDLGPFGLLRLENLQQRDFGSIFDKLKPMLTAENSEELLETLRVFLECESNYNDASKKLYHHTNTIRYRISKIQQMCDIDLSDPVERLKTEVTLRFLDLLK